jgi:hypothetical protein
MKEVGNEENFVALNRYRREIGKEIYSSTLFPTFHHLRAFTVALTTKNLKKDKDLLKG